MAEAHVLEAHRLTKDFGGFLAVKDVSLNIKAGTIHALIGPNGAGKTTVFNLISKVLTPTAGQILYSGRDITRLSAAAVARQGICRSFQISAVFPYLTVLDNVRAALQRPLGISLRFWQSARCLDELNETTVALLESVGLASYQSQRAGELPYGRKRALELAMTLAMNPKLLLLDEPTAGLGHEDIYSITKLIRSVAHGRTVLLVEHNLGVVADLSDSITVLQRGEVLAEGSYGEISRNPDVITAYLGVADA
jgi:branched-chain amino acid transport system ATP-binding protein